MTEAIALIAGVFLGIVVMAFLSADAYAKGAADEREKLWLSMTRRDQN